MEGAYEKIGCSERYTAWSVFLYSIVVLFCFVFPRPAGWRRSYVDKTRDELAKQITKTNERTRRCRVLGVLRSGISSVVRLAASSWPARITWPSWAMLFAQYTHRFYFSMTPTFLKWWRRSFVWLIYWHGILEKINISLNFESAKYHLANGNKTIITCWKVAWVGFTLNEYRVDWYTP